jgi:hypothetical protein
MKRLNSLILNAFAVAHAETDERVLLDKNDAQWSLKSTVGIFVSYPLINALMTIWMLMVVFEIGDESLFWSVFIAIGVVIVAVGIWTSGVYHDNIDTIWKYGNEIREDPDRGPGWARRRGNAYVIANTAYIVVMLWMML